MARLTSTLDTALDALLAGKHSADELESGTLEFKEDSGSERDTIRIVVEASVCFANSAGGTVVLGVSNSRRGPAAFVGTHFAADLLRRRVWEHTRPGLIVACVERFVAGQRLIIVSVPESPDIHSDQNGRATRRLEATCVPLTPSDQHRLREERGGIDWSAAPTARTVRDASPVAVAAARNRLATLADERRALSRASARDLLSALGVLREGRLTRAGELLFAEAGTANRPLIVYQHRSTPGGEPTTIERLSSPLLLAIDRSLELVQARRFVTPITLPNGQQIHIEDFPSLAVREAIINAVVHRDYHLTGPVSVEHAPEVLVVTSPGPLVSGVTPENILTHPSRPRNAALANAARVLGLAEEVGRGVDRIYREMIRAGRQLPRIESTFDQVRLSLVGGAPNTHVARYIAQLPAEERDDTETLLVVLRLCSIRTVTAADLAPLLQKSVEEAEAVLRRLSSSRQPLVEPTRPTAGQGRPTYRFTSDALKELGPAVTYHRRTVDEIDRKVIAHVGEYGRITNRTVQNLLDVRLQRARGILANLVGRGVLVKTSAHQRGPGVEYGRGPKFPRLGRQRKGDDQLDLPLAQRAKKRK